MGYRLYLILIGASAIIFLAILTVRPWGFTREARVRLAHRPHTIPIHSVRLP